MKTLRFLALATLALSMVVACSSDGQSIDDDERITGYVVGYETCGLSLGKAGYIVISEDLKDTLAVYGLPEIFEFPDEAFSKPTSGLTIMLNMAFPEKFRYAFKMKFTYTPSSMEEVMALGIGEGCAYPAFYLLQETYKNCVPVIIHSATKLETSLPDTPPAISGSWEVKSINISDKLTNIDSLPENALFSNISIEMPEVAQGTVERPYVLQYDLDWI
jgi:hypothetical protein